MASTQRKGARSVAEIEPALLEQLNNGSTETVNLVEWLAIDQLLLLKNILKQQKRDNWYKTAAAAVAELKKKTVNTINETIGKTLLQEAALQKDTEFLKLLATHTADMVRCWAAYTIGGNTALSLKKMLAQIRPFAADKHFGVREIAWLAVRPVLAKNIEEGIALLTPWTGEKDANLRRFASEATRPRGVWCAHIELLKNNPALGLPILQPLHNDPEKYVQDSAGNWLNDAAKTQPEFVLALCKKWQQQSPGKATAYIIKKATRSLL
jgi:3-methyladenine DNA glycosylase AlkC